MKTNTACWNGHRLEKDILLILSVNYPKRQKAQKGSPDEGPRRTETSHLSIKSLELMCHVHIF